MYNWEKHGRPIIDLGPKGTFDSVLVCLPCVVRDGDEYKLWCSGYDGKTWRIGLATSRDGINWAKDHRNPVLVTSPEN